MLLRTEAADISRPTHRRRARIEANEQHTGATALVVTLSPALLQGIVAKSDAFLGQGAPRLRLIMTPSDDSLIDSCRFD
jgi:hypothetical protein